jgi:hypothetical protein
MSKIRYTQEQIKKLLKNKNVSKCSEKSISYNKSFKIEAVHQYNDEGLCSREIFEKAGFDLNVIGKGKAKDCLQDWNKIFRIKGSEGLLNEKRGRDGGRSKTKWKTEAERIEYLEAQVAYLKAENDFLAKLRAKRAG